MLLSWVIVRNILMLGGVCLFAFSRVKWQAIPYCKPSRLLIVLRKSYITLVKVKFWSWRFRIQRVLFNWQRLRCRPNLILITCFVDLIWFLILLWRHGIRNASWRACLLTLLKLDSIAYCRRVICHLRSRALICLSKDEHILILLIFTLWVTNVGV